MIFRQVTSPGIAHYSYYLGSGRTAAVIDPRRDCGIYLKLAKENDQKISMVFETHRNEDYLIGSREIETRTGATVYHGPVTPFGYGNTVKDGDRFILGDLEISVLETPGHTLDSITLVVRDKNVPGEPFLVFTGDALFSGDVGRTDLIGPGKVAEASGMLFDSLWQKIIPLGDPVIVCPAHGAGSVCGVEISDHPLTTIGYEKAGNPHLAKTRHEFIENKTREITYVPPYFRKMEVLNLSGPPVIGDMPDIVPLSPGELKERARQGARILDIRGPGSYGAGHIPGSLSIWRDGLAAFMGWFLDYESPVILVDDFNLGLDAVQQHFVRLGFDNLLGYLSGGFSSWFKAGEPFSRHRVWSVHELERALEEDKGEWYLLDVRDIHNRGKNGHIRTDHHTYLGHLPGYLPPVSPDTPVIVYCDAGFKGCTAASILSMNGFHNVTNILGGMTAWRSAGFPVEQ